MGSGKKLPQVSPEEFYFKFATISFVYAEEIILSLILPPQVHVAFSLTPIKVDDCMPVNLFLFVGLSCWFWLCVAGQ